MKTNDILHLPLLLFIVIIPACTPDKAETSVAKAPEGPLTPSRPSEEITALRERNLWGRKGGVRRSVDEPTTLGAGAYNKPKRYSLTIKETEQGLMLYAERRLTMDDDRVEVGYLAYDLDKEEPELKIVSQPGPGCYWKTRSGTGKTRYLSILEIEHLQIPAGVMVGWELREKNGNLIVAKPESDAYKQSVWVGTYVEYDNLDDGK